MRQPTPSNIPAATENQGDYGFNLLEGRLEVSVRRSSRPFDDLCGIASRWNVKRPFLFVSKVLGKHWPVNPLVMAGAHAELASKVAAALAGEKGPAVFIGLAETAIGLARGVFDEFLGLGYPGPLFYSQTTRYNLKSPVAFETDEPHSHARSHLIYLPRSQAGRKIFSEATCLVLIDDEMTTGRTLLNLAGAFLGKAPRLKRLVFASFTNWLSEAALLAARDEISVPISFASLLEGGYRFLPFAGLGGENAKGHGGGQPNSSDNRSGPSDRENARYFSPVFNSVGDFTPKDRIIPSNYGRLGLSPEDCKALSVAAERKALSLSLPKGQKVRVIGTGEFLHEPFLMAKCLEKNGHEVIFQSSTRTPIATGGAIRNALRFPDNYFEGLDNFLYNLDGGFDGETIVAYETAGIPDNHTLPTALKAKAVFFP
jgi:hypothetical protein